MAATTTENLNLWKGRIERSKGLQSSQHKSWNTALDLYNCVFFNKVYGSDLDRVDVHFAKWYIDNLIPLVYFRDPYLFIKARHEKYSGFSETMETVLNHLWGELGLKQEFKRIIMSSFLMPPGWIKLGYTAKIGVDVAKIEEEKRKNLVKEIKDTIQGIFKKEKEITKEELGVISEYIKEESIFANWIPSWNILMPEGYHLIPQMPYLIEMEEIPMEDFIANPLYKNKNVKPDKEASGDAEGGELRKPSYLGIKEARDNEIITLYHVWDKRNQERMTISFNANEPHFRGDWPYDMEGFPYKPLYFEETLPSKDKANPYPPNVLESILPQIIEQSQSRTMMVRHRRRAAAYLLVQRGLLTEEDLKQLEAAEDMQIVTVSNIGAVQAGPIPAMAQDVYAVDSIIKQDLQTGTNMGQMMFQAQPGQRTATQAQIGQSGLQLKSSARIDVIEDFTVLVARSMAQLAWQFFDKDKVSEITGNLVTGQMWPDLPDDKKERRRIIQAELQFKIDAGSTSPPKDETVDRKQVLDLASIVASIAPERLNKGEFVKQILKKFKFAKELDRIVLSNDEDEIRAAQEENQLLAKDIPQVVSPNENHLIHIQQHSQAPPTRSLDLHMASHGDFLGIKMGQDMSGIGNKPQKGDTRPPMRSSNPEIVRQGITNQGDIYQSVQNQGVGTGAEAQ